MNKLIFGKDTTDNIVSIELKGNELYIFKEDEFGISKEIRNTDYPYWILFDRKSTDNIGRLKGDLHYSYFLKFSEESTYNNELQSCYRSRQDFFTIRDNKERIMCKEGITYFGLLKASDVSVLSFDIETTGISHNENSKTLLISNTYKKNNYILKKLFKLSDYNSDKEMIDAWCKWVRQINPSVMTGHNIFGFDFPYLQYCAGELQLGRDESVASFSKRPRQFRKDGSQSYEYHDISIFGREVVDTFFLSIKYDVGRKYSSYSLKTIIKEEGLEKQNRIKWNFDEKPGLTVWAKHLVGDSEDWHRFCEYCEDDADDSLKLYELMIPSFFYLTQSIPMSLQAIINRASGSQINAFMVRAYIQDGHSIPASSDPEHYPGGISFGNPGIYKNVYKVDVASLYPSIIRQYSVYDYKKDPNKYFLEMVNYFTDQRLENKRLAKETGDRYYKDLEQSQKIMINSAYGFMGAPGLNFNSPKNAAKVTRIGREILQKGIDYAESNDLLIVNADTDSFSFTNFDWDFDKFIDKLNAEFPKNIVWENDGFYDSVLIVKAKNYALKQGDNVKIKGSALKASMKEPMLKLTIKSTISLLLGLQSDEILNMYNRMAVEITRINDITKWCSKKTITNKILSPKRTNEQRIADALGNKIVQEGDKIHVFFKSKTELCLLENFDGEYCQDTLFDKLYKSMKIFETVLDIKQFPNYKLKKNKKLLQQLIDGYYEEVS